MQASQIALQANAFYLTSLGEKAIDEKLGNNNAASKKDTHNLACKNLRWGKNYCSHSVARSRELRAVLQSGLYVILEEGTLGAITSKLY